VLTSEARWHVATPPVAGVDRHKRRYGSIVAPPSNNRSNRGNVRS
jgi:hypothetical protein